MLEPALTPDHLQHFIAERQLCAQLVPAATHTPTVPAAAAALGVETDQIIKTLLFLVGEPGTPAAAPRPVVVISHGEKRVDKRLLGAQLGVGRKQVHLASPEVVLALLGYPAGGVPPFGHRTTLPVIVDASILALRERYAGVIFAGGGDDRTMLRLTVDELLAVTGAAVAAVSQTSLP